MTTYRKFRRTPRRGNHHARQSGQTLIFIVMVLSIMLFGFFALVTDYGNVWQHRQMVQTAADAACEAGAMDLLMASEKTPVPAGVSWTSWGAFGTSPSAFNCSTSDSRVPCKYATFNGYSGGTLINGANSNQVAVSFPNADPNGNPIDSKFGVTAGFIRVTITDRVRTYFAGLVTNATTVDVVATAECGLVPKSLPTPIVVLHPNAANAFSVQGAPKITILGGPQRSVQVNSTAEPTAANIGGSAIVDLSQAGPANNGGDFGVFGGPATAPAGFVTANSGRWISPASAFSDPYAQVGAPTPAPANAANPTAVAFGVNGCPDPVGCAEFVAGKYSGGGINIPVKVGATTYNTAIFDPGLYYMQAGGFQVSANGVVRPSTAAGDGSGGTVFYLVGAAKLPGGASSVLFNSNAVTNCPLSSSGVVAANCLARYLPAGGTETYLTGAGTKTVTSPAMKCPAGPAPPTGVPATANGNILLGPCSGTYGDPGLQYRGFVFFQDRSAAAQPSLGGGANFLLAGLLYFHQCNTSGTGTNCSAPGTNAYGATLSLQGGAGAGAYTVGNVVADTLSLGGNSAINMILNPSNSFTVLKVQVLQ